MSKVALPYLPTPPGMDKVQFGHKFFCLPYLPIQLVWTFWNLSLDLGQVSKRGVGPSYLVGYRIFSVFLGSLDNCQQFQGGRNYFQNFQGGFWDFSYFYKYGHQYLTYLPPKFLSKLFFYKKSMAEKYPTYLWFGRMSKLLQFFFLTALLIRLH